MDCYLCKDAGRNQAAHRVLAGGKGVCNEHLSAMTDRASVCAVSVTAAPPVVRAVPEPPKENTMNHIDIQALKRDYEEGMRWPEIQKKHGASRTTLIKRLTATGVTLRGPGNRGRAEAAGNAHNPRAAALPKLQRKAAKPAAHSDGSGVVTLCLTEAALDAFWSGLALDKKAQSIESLT